MWYIPVALKIVGKFHTDQLTYLISVSDFFKIYTSFHSQELSPVIRQGFLHKKTLDSVKIHINAILIQSLTVQIIYLFITRKGEGRNRRENQVLTASV